MRHVNAKKKTLIILKSPPGHHPTFLLKCQEKRFSNAELCLGTYNRKLLRGQAENDSPFRPIEDVFL